MESFYSKETKTDTGIFLLNSPSVENGNSEAFNLN